jgi:hydroxyethylthiazole kinase-like uncharacterized protein yjeF
LKGWFNDMANSAANATALFTISELRAIEQAALATLPPHTLMQRAGIAAAVAARRLAPAGESMRNTVRILVLAGPGNNGGDALIAACELADSGYAVSVMLIDATKRPPDAENALKRARTCRITWVTLQQITHGSNGAADDSAWTLVLDGLFGIGMQRPFDAACQALVKQVNALYCPILALDIASGLDADTGRLANHADAVRATHTITFIGDKPGLHTGDGRDYSGQVQIADLDIAPALFTTPTAVLNTPGLFAAELQPLLQNSHKGSFGDVNIVGGATGMAGAVILAARAAARSGAGRVYAGFIDHAPSYDAPHPELMCRAADTLALVDSTVAVGPGLGLSRAAHDLLGKALHTAANLVLDADALNLIAAEPTLQQKLSLRQHRNASAATLMTPHPLEAARLLGVTAAAIQADRPQAARRLAQQFQAIIVLKGSGTVIARPDGLIAINPTGNPALATAGSGDVLTGVCAALLAQGWQPWPAALGAAWLHGAAADALVAQGCGPVGLTASELDLAIRHCLNQLILQWAD